jgi:hypothetical protein
MEHQVQRSKEMRNLLSELEAQAQELLAPLSRRERDVIEVRYGLGVTDEKRRLVWAEVGRIFSLSRARVHQIHKEGLGKLSEGDQGKFRELVASIEAIRKGFHCRCGKFRGIEYEWLRCDKCEALVIYRG